MTQPSGVVTVDVELWTWRGDYELDVAKPVETLLGLAKDREIPITFFVALSDKGLGRSADGDYLKRTLGLVSQIAENDFSDVAVHTHCRNIPVGFQTPHDEISAYGADECAELLSWNVAEITRASGRAPCAHRAANFSLPSFGPDTFYDQLTQVGLSVDSSDISIPYSGPARRGAVLEMPPATTPYMGVRHKVWSPDTMSVAEMLEFAGVCRSESDTLVMNCHSFMIGAAEFYRPEQTLMKTWFKLPPGVQAVLRPPLKVLKRARRSLRTTAHTGDSPVADRLTQVIDGLREGGFNFTDFRSIAEKGKTS